VDSYESELTQVKLDSDGPKRCIRRIYARETVELKPFSQTNVAVKYSLVYVAVYDLGLVGRTERVAFGRYYDPNFAA
jgi:ribosomal protein S8E